MRFPSLEFLLMLGYAISLACVAAILEWAASHAHRRSVGLATAGFTYHPERDTWRLALGLALLLGIQGQVAALLSGLLLGAFGLAMTLAGGPKSLLDHSVFTASAAAFHLGCVAGKPAQGDPVRQSQ